MALTAPTAGGGRAGKGSAWGWAGDVSAVVSSGRFEGTRHARRRPRRLASEASGASGAPGAARRGRRRSVATAALVAEMESVRDEGERGRARGRTSVVRDEDLADDPRASSGEHIVLVLYLGSSHCGRGEGRVRHRGSQGREPSRLVRRPIVARTHRHGGERRRVDALVPVCPLRVARLRRESHARAFAPPRGAPRVVAPSTIARASVGCSSYSGKQTLCRAASGLGSWIKASVYLPMPSAGAVRDFNSKTDGRKYRVKKSTAAEFFGFRSHRRDFQGAEDGSRKTPRTRESNSFIHNATRSRSRLCSASS